MNMSAQRDRDVPGQVGNADHICPETEGEVPWAAGPAFNALTQAQHANISRQAVAVQGGEDLRKPATNVVRVRETHERNAYSACFEDEGARSVEDVQVVVQGQQGKGHAAAFVI